MERTTLGDEQARLLRLRSQRLDRRRTPAAGVVETVRELCGVHAQLPSASALALRPRTSGLAAADVERARAGERALLRTWCMRGTFHLIATPDAGWLLALLGPVLIAKAGRRHAELGLDEDTFARALRVIRRALSRGGPLTRAELAERLAAAGVDPSGQRIAHLVHRAGLEGLVCHGPDRGAEPTFVLLEDWTAGEAALPRSIDREVALGELARRYLAAYGPAGPRDLAWWSGLEVREARTAWSRVAGELIEVEVAGEPAWLPASRAAWLADPGPSEPLVHLLPGFDPLMLGYRSRSLAVPDEHARAVWTGGGFIKPTLTVNGLAVATWSSTRRAHHLEVTVEPFDGLPGRLLARLEAEVADVGRFLEVAASLRLGGAPETVGNMRLLGSA
jgi:Winged helix DNA-binding domain